jgi:hypothetical protein
MKIFTNSAVHDFWGDTNPHWVLVTDVTVDADDQYLTITLDDAELARLEALQLSFEAFYCICGDDEHGTCFDLTLRKAITELPPTEAAALRDLIVERGHVSDGFDRPVRSGPVYADAMRQLAVIFAPASVQ